jgi:hypothetical protein
MPVFWNPQVCARPQHPDLADALPRNPDGKVFKRELRERYASG